MFNKNEEKKSATISQKIIAFCMIVVCCCLLFSFVWLIASYLIPALSLQLYKQSNADAFINMGIPFVNLPLAHLITLSFVWLLPSIFVIIVLFFAMIPVFKYVANKIVGFFYIIKLPTEKKNNVNADDSTIIVEETIKIDGLKEEESDKIKENEDKEDKEDKEVMLEETEEKTEEDDIKDIEE